MRLNRKKLEQRIANLFGYREAVLFGQGRSGVVALLEVLGLNCNAVFVMPSNICSSLMLAVHTAGLKINLVEVSELNGLASDNDLLEAMKKVPVPGVIMPAHLYGFVQSYEKTITYARKHGWFVLENDTIATKAQLGAGIRNAFGDALLVSFGYSKAIEAGGGGGLLTDDGILARELQKREQTYFPLNHEAIKAEEAFMLFERQLRTSHFLENDFSCREREKKIFERMPTFKYSFPENLGATLDQAIDKFPEKVADRLQKVEMWNRFLEPFNNSLLLPEAICLVPWRLIRRVPGIRDNIVAALRNAGIDAGTNFPPLSKSFSAMFSGLKFDRAEQWGAEVLNLWLTSDYDAHKMRQAADIIGFVIKSTEQHYR